MQKSAYGQINQLRGPEFACSFAVCCCSMGTRPLNLLYERFWLFFCIFKIRVGLMFISVCFVVLLFGHTRLRSCFYFFRDC